MNMALSHEVTSAISALVKSGFDNTLFDHFSALYQIKSQCLNDPGRRAMFYSAVQMYLDFASDCYKPYNRNFPVLQNCNLDMAISRPYKRFVSHSTRYGADHFVRMCQLLQICHADVVLALKCAVTSKFYDYVRWFCLKDPLRPEVSPVLVDSLWTPCHLYVRLMTSCYDPETLLAQKCAVYYLKKTMVDRMSWDNLSELSCLVKPVQDAAKGNQALGMLMREDKPALWGFVFRCAEVEEWPLTVVLPLLMGEWSLLHRAATRLPRAVKEEYFALIVERLGRGVSLDVALEILIALMEGNWKNTLAYTPRCFRPSKIRRLVEMCRGTRDQWMVFFMVQGGQWNSVKQFTFGTGDTDVVDMAVVLASRKRKWDLVRQLMPKSSNSQEISVQILKSAVGDLRPDFVEEFLPFVNLGGMSFNDLICDNLLREDKGAVSDTDLDEDDDKANSVWERLDHFERNSLMHIIMLIMRHGIATNAIDPRVALSMAIIMKATALVRLLVRSGVVTLSACISALQNREVREVMENDVNVRLSVEDIVRRVSLAGTMSLHDAVLFH